MQQVHDQLELVQALVISDFRLISRFDERLESLYDQLRRAAAQHGLLAKQIRLGFLRERRLEHAAARTADAVRVGERLLLRFATRVLGDRDQARYAASLLELPAHEISRSFRRDQHDVEVLAWLDLTKMDIEAVREEQCRAPLQSLFDVVVECLLREIRHQHRDEVRTTHSVDRLCDLEPILLGLLPTSAGLAHADGDVVAAVLEVECVGTSLAAIAQDRDARTLQCALVDVFARIQPHESSRIQNRVAAVGEIQVAQKRNPASALPVRGSLSVCLWIDPQAKAPHLRASSRPIRGSRSSTPATAATSDPGRRAVIAAVEILVVIGAEKIELRTIGA